MTSAWKIPFLSAALGAAVLSASVSAGHPQQELYDERPDEYMDPVEAYLRMKAEEISQNHQVLQRLRLHRDVDAIYEQIDTNNVFADYNLVGDTAEQRTLVADALAMTAAQYLSSSGMTAKKLNSSQQAGFDPIVSATKVVVGAAQFDDLAAVGEFVVLGTVDGIQRSDFGDQVSIRIIDSSFDFGTRTLGFTAHRANLQAGQECMFFVSRSLALVNSERRGSAAPLRLTQQFDPFCKTPLGYASTSPYLVGEVEMPDALGVLAAKKLATDDN